jgi:hypothetical protein
MFLLGRVKIPLIGYTSPKLISIDSQSVQVKIKLRRRTKNHLSSMYFGALAVGADIAGGIQVFYFSKFHQKYKMLSSFWSEMAKSPFPFGIPFIAFCNSVSFSFPN